MQYGNKSEQTEESKELFEQWLAWRVDPKNVKPITSRNIVSINSANSFLRSVFDAMNVSRDDAFLLVSKTWFANCGLLGLFNYYYSYCNKYYGIDVRSSSESIVRLAYGMPFATKDEDLLNLYKSFLFSGQRQFPDTKLDVNRAFEQASMLFDYYIKKHPDDAWTDSEELYRYFADERGWKYIKAAKLVEICRCVYDNDPLLFLHYTLEPTTDGLGKNEESYEKAKIYREELSKSDE